MKFIFLLLLSWSCGKVINEAGPSYSPLSVDMETMRWGIEDLPISLKVSDNLDSRSKILIGASLDEWERAGDINFFSAIQTTPNLNFSALSDYYHKDRFVNGIYLANHKIDELSDSTLAVTQIFFYTNRESPSNPYYHIIHTDIIINGYHYTFSTNPFDESKHYLLTLILHEVGHVLGVGHQNQGIMYPSMSTYDKQETLTSFDLNLVSEKYASAQGPALNGNKINTYSPAPEEIKRILIFLPAARVLSNKRFDIRKRSF